ncbi:hypothetical protein F2Q68_00031314 [Brassica cretica]|uniref:Uncharacterized protein n=1 Tax=Brassica cretica TaxID=69181 RepID=A0A8S9GCR9_BRACR|nr:hypothetical protein F2Q68_00031314 [Brassica cretica]
MDLDSEVKKRERLTRCILKLKDNKLTGVRIESSGSRKPRILRKSLSSRQDSRVDELNVVNGNRVGQVVRGLRWNLNELAQAMDGLIRDNLKELTFEWNVSWECLDEFEDFQGNRQAGPGNWNWKFHKKVCAVRELRLSEQEIGSQVYLPKTC